MTERPHSQIIATISGYLLLIFVDFLAVKVDIDTSGFTSVIATHCRRYGLIDTDGNGFNDLIVVCNRRPAANVTDQ
ncbi:MAG: hypothetical protein J6J01_05510, partial [Oscillospiraceae bacterium]|nr:hypothetical protein [Oscillospiraceae bacterium]